MLKQKEEYDNYYGVNQDSPTVDLLESSDQNP